MRNKILFFFIFILGLTMLFVVVFNFSYANENKNLNISSRHSEILIKFNNSSKINIVKVAQNTEYEKILDFYKNDPEIEFAEPNYLYEASAIPNDVYYNRQWYLEKIGASSAWDKVSNANDIIIAIIDSGVQIEHPDLKDNIWQNIDEIPNNGIDDDSNGFIDDSNGWDFINNISDPSPKFDLDFTEEGIMHGTIIAGIASAHKNNKLGIAGVGSNALIMPLRVLDDRGEGKVSTVIRAIDYAIANKADIINFSFVGLNFSKALEDAIKRAYNAGIIIVAASGNEKENNGGNNLDNVPMYPVCHDGEDGENMVVGVAAVDAVDQKTLFSSYGFNCIDITAPGVSIFSTVVYEPIKKINNKVFDKYYDGYWAGTSMATPIVSGGLALLIQANPKVSSKEAVKILLETSDNISRLNPKYLGQLGSGRININSAIEEALRIFQAESVKILTVQNIDSISEVKLTNKDGILENKFQAYEDYFLGGSNLSNGDINGDGKEEIITGAGFGGGPHVRIFDMNGIVLGQFFAYDKDFQGGVNVAVGDVNGDGINEIITTSGNGNTPEIRIFDSKGNIKNKFFAYHPNFTKGVYVASGDVNGDNVDEIIVGAGNGGGPHVRIFDMNGIVLGQFFAYDKDFRGGVKVAVANIDGGVGKKKSEIITAAGKGGGPHIKIFDDHAILKNQFFAYDKSFKGGVSIATGDIDGDGLLEIITGAGPGGTPHVRVFEINGKLISSYFAYDNAFSGGVNVGVLNIKK